MSMLTQEEKERLIAAARAGGPKSPEDLERILQWAHQVRCDNSLLELALAGEIVIAGCPGKGEELRFLPKLEQHKRS